MHINPSTIFLGFWEFVHGCYGARRVTCRIFPQMVCLEPGIVSKKWPKLVRLVKFELWQPRTNWSWWWFRRCFIFNFWGSSLKCAVQPSTTQMSRYGRGLMFWSPCIQECLRCWTLKIENRQGELKVESALDVSAWGVCWDRCNVIFCLGMISCENQNQGWLGYIRHYITQFFKDYNKPV